MKEVIAIIVFCFVLFIYLHVCFHLKKVDDLEIYEICQPSKEKLEEVCDLRQPVVTDFMNEKLMTNCNLFRMHVLLLRDFNTIVFFFR